MKQALDGWAPPTEPRRRAGQDHRLVPGQQGPGGRQMVNRRHWFRSGPKPVRPMSEQIRSAQPQAASLGLDGDVEPRVHASGRSDERSAATVRRLLFINQYYWPDHASTAQHLTDLAESLAAQGYECHVLCVAGPLQARRARAAGVRSARGRSHPPRAGHVAGPARHLGPDDRLPQLLRPGGAQGGLCCPGSTRSSRSRRRPFIGLIGTLLSRLKGTPHVYWSMDLHPDASLALRRMSPRNPLGRAAWPG